MLSVTLTRHPVSTLTPAPAVPALERSAKINMGNKTSQSVPEIKQILEAFDESVVRITFSNGDIFVLEPDHEVDFETYQEDGRWYCHIVEAVSGTHPDFHRLFKPGGCLDIFEQDILEIKDESTNKIIYPTNQDKEAEQDVHGNTH
jgi:hypothetical protein